MKPFLTAAFVAAGLTAVLPASEAKAQSEPFLGQISWFGGTFAPRGWAFCDGQLLPINQNQALYSLLGTTYGGDGRTTFALPDVRGRVPIHAGQGAGLEDFREGTKGGSETVTLNVAEMPAHSHSPQLKATSTAADGTSPSGAPLAEIRCQHILGRGRHPECHIAERIGYRNCQGRQPGARKPATLADPELHHCAARPLSVAQLGHRHYHWSEEMTLNFSKLIAGAIVSVGLAIGLAPGSAKAQQGGYFMAQVMPWAGNFPPVAGRFVTGNCCRLHRTRRCFRFLAPPMAAMAAPPLACRTCAADPFCILAEAPVFQATDLVKRAGLPLLY